MHSGLELGIFGVEHGFPVIHRPYHNIILLYLYLILREVRHRGAR
jgi:hypothetical protein